MTNQDNIVYNDCFYTAMEHNFDFVAILDPDEVREPAPKALLQMAVYFYLKPAYTKSS